MLTLMILVGSTWMGLYLAKRITRPVQMLATAADEIGAGRLDHRVKAETGDEFGSADRRLQPHGWRPRREPSAARALVGRARAQTSRRRRPSPLCRNGARPPGHRRGLDRRHRQHSHLERRGVTPARHGCARRRLAGVGRLRHAGAEPARHRHRRGLTQPRGHASAGRLGDPRRARGPPRGDDHAAAPRRRGDRRHGGGLRRRLAAHSRAEEPRPGARWRGGWRTRSRTR